MTTKAGRINKTDIRHGKTLWEVQYTWSDMLRRHVPVIERFSVLDRPASAAQYGEALDLRNPTHVFTVRGETVLDERSAFVQMFMKGFFGSRKRAAAWLKLHGASDLQRMNEQVINDHFPTWNESQIKVLKSRIAEGVPDQIRLATEGKSFEQHEVELYVINKERFHARMEVMGHIGPAFDRDHTRRLAVFAQQNNAPGYVMANPDSLEGKMGDFAKPYDPVTDVEAKEAIASHLLDRGEDGIVITDAARGKFTTFDPKAKFSGDLLWGAKSVAATDSPLYKSFDDTAIGMRGRMDVDGKLTIDSYDLVNPQMKDLPEAPADRAITAADLRAMTEDALKEATIPGKPATVEAGELTPEDAKQGYSWPVKITAPTPAGVDPQAFEAAMRRAQEAMQAGNNPDVHLLKEGVKIPNQEEDDGSAEKEAGSN